MQLRRVSAVALMVVLGTVCVTTAGAQERGRGAGRGGMMGRGGGLAMLLRMKPVQEELKLTSEQSDKVTKIADDAAESMRGAFGNLRDASADERREAGEKMAKQMAESNKKIEAVLKPEQAARAKELSLQLRGVGALSDPEVAKALKLTDDQSKKLTELTESNRPGRGQGGGGADASDEDRAAARERFARARQEQESKAMEVLTADQREEFGKMKGKKFDFPAPQVRPGAGAGTGAGGNRRRATT